MSDCIYLCIYERENIIKINFIIIFLLFVPVCSNLSLPYMDVKSERTLLLLTYNLLVDDDDNININNNDKYI